MLKGRVAEKIRLSGSWCLLVLSLASLGTENIIRDTAILQRIQAMLISYSLHQHGRLAEWKKKKKHEAMIKETDVRVTTLCPHMMAHAMQFLNYIFVF
jgi:hypothetical protein